MYLMFLMHSFICQILCEIRQDFKFIETKSNKTHVATRTIITVLLKKL